MVALLLLTAGCFGRGERAAAPDSEPTATTSAPAPVETATPSKPDAEEEASDAMPLMGEVRAVEDVPEINSYRTHITIRSQTERGEETHQLAMLYVDGIRYMSMGDMWIQAPAQTFSDISELTLLTPQNVSGIVDQMEVVGTETVNELVATHDRGSIEIIPVVGTESDSLDVSRVESAQIEIWADETHHAIIKVVLEASNTEPPMTSLLTFEYTDLNSDITIEAPATLPVNDTRLPKVILYRTTS